MKLAFVGKGGSGKTTISALVSRFLASAGLPVIAIDADINQHLGVSLGFTPETVGSLPRIGMELDRVKEFFIGKNPRIQDIESMIRTTPPGRGSRFMALAERNEFTERFFLEFGGIRFASIGHFTEEDLGVKCYHGKLGGAEILLNHLIDDKGEYVIVDMTAGADSFSTGLFSKFDMTFIVVEPTAKSLDVFHQYTDYARDFDIRISVIANKIEDASDLRFVRDAVGDAHIATFSRSQYIRSLEKGVLSPISALETENKDAITAILRTIDQTKKDWQKFFSDAVLVHKKTAESRPESRDELLAQIDNEFDWKNIPLIREKIAH